MIRLNAYSSGTASWYPNNQQLSPAEKNACRDLHSKLIDFVEKCLHPLMARTTTREMETFTMHDHAHGLKVAHLMWHILKPERRELLSPGEIGLLITSAHLHDLGMGLSPGERRERLRPDSDIWDRVDSRSAFGRSLKGLIALSSDPDISDAIKAQAVQQVQQAQEALLCLDTRERHASAERYWEIIHGLENAHFDDPARIPDIRSALSFDGDSFEDKLIEICVSHNEDAYRLLDRDASDPGRDRFPTRFPIGCSVADKCSGTGTCSPTGRMSVVIVPELVTCSKRIA